MNKLATFDISNDENLCWLQIKLLSTHTCESATRNGRVSEGLLILIRRTDDSSVAV